jgi:nucleotide-binding universal stress UspA family protein
MALWATDGSEAAERASAVARSIAQTYGAKLLVVRVSEALLADAPLAVVAAQESADAVDATLRQKVEDLKRDGVSAELVSSGIDAWRGACERRVRPRPGR